MGNSGNFTVKIKDSHEKEHKGSKPTKFMLEIYTFSNLEDPRFLNILYSILLQDYKEVEPEEEKDQNLDNEKEGGKIIIKEDKFSEQAQAYTFLISKFFLYTEENT